MSARFIHILGPQGCGKTTLAKRLAGELIAKGEIVEIFDELNCLTGRECSSLRRRLSCARRLPFTSRLVTNTIIITCAVDRMSLHDRLEADDELISLDANGKRQSQ